MRKIRVFLSVVAAFLIFDSLYAQNSAVSPSEENGEFVAPKFEKKSYNEMYFQVGTRGYSMGLSHLKDLSPRTTILVGASYGNFRMPTYNLERNYIPASIYNLRSELRYFVTPRDQRLTAFVYAAVNNTYMPMPGKSNFNLGLEVGGEARYKISENASFSVRTSFYRQNGNPYYGNTYYSPLGIDPGFNNMR